MSERRWQVFVVRCASCEKTLMTTPLIGAVEIKQFEDHVRSCARHDPRGTIHSPRAPRWERSCVGCASGLWTRREAWPTIRVLPNCKPSSRESRASRFTMYPERSIRRKW